MKGLILTLMIMFLAVVTSVSCVTFPHGNDPVLLAKADFGSYPNKEKIEQLVMARLNIILFDPRSMQDFKMLGFKQGWLSRKQVLTYGYETRVFFNAKNRMGGYVGLQEYFLFVHNDRVIFFESIWTRTYQGKLRKLFGSSWNEKEFYTRSEKMKR